jgi:hypothetical protein
MYLMRKFHLFEVERKKGKVFYFYQKCGKTFNNLVRLVFDDCNF